MMTRGFRVGLVLTGVVLAVPLALAPETGQADSADAADTILKIVLPLIDPNLGESYELLKCTVKQNGLSEATLKICGASLAKEKADAYLQGDSTAQQVVQVSLAAMHKQWGTVVERSGTELLVQLACSVAMPPGPMKTILCNYAGEVVKLGKGVVREMVVALSQSPPDWVRLLTLGGPKLVCVVMPEPAHSTLCSPIMQALAKGVEAGKDVVEGLANALGDGVGTAVNAIGEVINPSDPKPEPKKFFRLYYVNYYHKGAWLKLVKGDAAFDAYVSKTHQTCLGYYGGGACDVMRNTYVKDITAVVSHLRVAAQTYFDASISREDRFRYYLLYVAGKGGPSALPGGLPPNCGAHFYTLFPLPEGQDEDSRPRPTVWVMACQPVNPLLRADFTAHKAAYDQELQAVTAAGCNLLIYNQHLHCGTYAGQAACLTHVGAQYANYCEMDYAKADGAVAASFVKQLGKRCAASPKVEAWIECSRPWKQAQCADLVEHTTVPSPWKKPQIKCLAKPDPQFEQGKQEALKLVSALNTKPGPPSTMLNAAQNTGAGCTLMPDPLEITCKNPDAMPPGISLAPCPPDPNKDGADGPSPCYAGPYSFKAAQKAAATAGVKATPPETPPPGTAGGPGAAGTGAGNLGTRGPITSGGPPRVGGSSVAVAKPPSGADMMLLPLVTVGGVTGRWGSGLTVDARQSAGPSRSAPGLCDFVVRHTVKNAGLVAAAPSAGTWRNAAVAGGWAHGYPSLGPGAESAQTDTLPLRVGQNALSLQLDVRAQIGETNEANNEARLIVTVTGGCPSAPVR